MDGLINEDMESGGRHAERIWAICVLAVAGCLYFWTVISGGEPLSAKMQSDDLYNRLSDAFLAGRFSFVEAPDPGFSSLEDPWDPEQNAAVPHLHDASYYHGRYYLYFGPAPAVLLLAPWKALTGKYLGENVAVAVFVWVGVAAEMALALAIKRRHFPEVPAWVSGLGFVAIAFCNFALPMLRRPVFYELAIASAFAFAMISILCIVRAMGSGTHRIHWLFLASLAYGMILASRPNYLFGAVVLLVPFLPAWRASKQKSPFDRRTLMKELASVGLPLCSLGLLLAFYNLRRFGDPFEFGNHYQLSGMHPRLQAPVSAGFIPTNLWFYLLAPAQWSAYFPFVQVIHIPWFKLPDGYSGEEDMYGMLTNLPYIWMAFLLYPLWRDRSVREAGSLKDLCGGLLAMIGLNAVVLLRLNGANNRYLVDLVPTILILACVGVFWVEAKDNLGWRKGVVRCFWICALGLTALLNILVSINHNDLYRTTNPISYRRLAHAFNHLSSWLGETSNSKTGPVKLRLRFPQDKVGQLEPLMVTGLSFRADFIYLYYADSDSIQIGFEHTSYGGCLTKPPIELDYGKEHSVEIEMGSLYPPFEHPYFDGVPAEMVMRLKHTLEVRLDGQIVLSGTYDFYDSSPGDVSVGANRVSDAFGRRFTGQILQVERASESSH